MAVITLPSNVDAEKCVLGAMLLASDAADIALGSLEESDFANVEPRNRMIFHAMRQLHENDRPIDAQTLIDELISLHYDKNVSPDYIFELINTVINADNIDHYVQMVKDQSVLRELLLKFGEIQDQYSKGVPDISSFIASSNDMIAEICQKRTVQEMRPVSEVAATVAENISKSSEIETKGLVGLDTGYKRLNEMTHGWRKGDLIILAARPSVGKTTLGINLAFQTAAREKVPVAFFSLEMSSEQVVEKLIACRSMVPGDHITTGFLNKTEKQKISAAISEISRTHIYFDDTPNAKLGDIISKAHKLKKERPDLGFIVVDYLGRIRYSEHPNIAQRQQEISEISGALKTLARELDVPVLCIAQLNRNVDQNENKVPSLSNLRDSGSIEQDADVVMLLYRSDYYTSLGQKAKEKGNKGQNQGNQQQSEEEPQEGEGKKEEKKDKGVSETQVIIAKNRKGQTGIVHLVFQKPYSRFDDPSPEYEARIAEMERRRGTFSEE